MLDWLNFSTPYRAGGIADQPFAFFHRMKAAYNVYSVILRWRGSRRGSNWLEFQRNNPDEWKIVEAIVMLRKETENTR